MKLENLKNGDVFEIGGIKLVKVCEKDGAAFVVSKDLLFDMRFGKSNNFRESEVLERLKNEILPKIEKGVGVENVLEFETDLRSLDGSRKHGTLKSRIALPTFDFYRDNVEVFDKHPVKDWWFTATADSTTQHTCDDWVVCVSPFGYIYDINYYFSDFGVRPLLFLKSFIDVSCKE